MENKLERVVKTPKLLDLDRGLLVFEGAPITLDKYGAWVIDIPTTPHVFIVKRLWFNRKLNPCYEQIRVLIGHAGFVYKNGKYIWIFTNGQSVSGTAKAYSNKTNQQIDFVVACSSSYADLSISPFLIPLPDDIEDSLLTELPIHETYALKETVGVQSALIVPETEEVNLSINLDLMNLKNPRNLEAKKSKQVYQEM